VPVAPRESSKLIEQLASRLKLGAVGQALAVVSRQVVNDKPLQGS